MIHMIFSNSKKCVFASLQHNAQLAGAYDIKNHIELQ